MHCMKMYSELLCNIVWSLLNTIWIWFLYGPSISLLPGFYHNTKLGSSKRINAYLSSLQHYLQSLIYGNTQMASTNEWNVTIVDINNGILLKYDKKKMKVFSLLQLIWNQKCHAKLREPESKRHTRWACLYKEYKETIKGIGKWPVETNLDI